MKRNVRTKLDYETFSMSRDYSRMEKEITNRDRMYKQKWDDQNRHPKIEKHWFRIGDRVLLKKRKQSKWSLAIDNEHYIWFDHRCKAEFRRVYCTEGCVEIQTTTRIRGWELERTITALT